MVRDFVVSPIDPLEQPLRTIMRARMGIYFRFGSFIK